MNSEPIIHSKIFFTKLGIFFFFMILIGCKNENTAIKEAGKTILLPSELGESIQGSEFRLKDLDNQGIKVISHLNAGCTTCYTKLKAWKSLIREWKQEYDLTYIFIAKGTPENRSLKPMLDYMVNERIKFSYPVFYDENGEFEKLNLEFLHGDLFETFLLDRDNNILLQGSPLSTKSLEKEYHEILGQIMN